MDQHNPLPLGKAEVILFATDGSDYTEGAAQEAIFFSQACGAKLIILYVVSIDSEVAATVHAQSAGAIQELKPYFENMEKMAADHDIECETVTVQSYQPEKTIVEEAYRHKADIIIMGRHGKRGLRQLLVGSMTAKVIGQGYPKVLVVPKDFMITGENILLATDGSEFSDLATKEALSLAKLCKALKKLIVYSGAKRESDRQSAEDLVDSVKAQMEENGVGGRCEYITDVGSPAERIVAIAQEKNVDLIIMGGFGKGFSKLLMGHVTERVIGKTHCAVLVIEK